MDTIILKQAWCEVHFANCWHKNEAGITKPLCDPENIFEPAGTVAFAKEMQSLKEKGYIPRHTYPSYTLTRYKSQPLTLPLDWQTAIEERPEYVDVDQDW